MSVDNFLVYIGVNLDANDETAMEEAGKHRMSVSNQCLSEDFRFTGEFNQQIQSLC